MNANFTKGPWGVGGSDEGGMKSVVYCDDVSGSAVAMCEFDLVKRSQEEMLANMHLIAAAPELYEALKEMEEFVDMECGIGAFSSSCKSAVKALAKARGEG